MAVACVLESQHLSSETDPALWTCVKIKQISTREMLIAAFGTGWGLGKCWFYFSSLERGKAMDGPPSSSCLGGVVARGRQSPDPHWPARLQKEADKEATGAGGGLSVDG